HNDSLCTSTILLLRGFWPELEVAPMKQQQNTHKHNGEERSIGQAADLLSREFPDVTVSSLRFLEREGLLSPKRKPGGHRVYTTHDLYRARKIKQWQAERKS